VIVLAIDKIYEEEIEKLRKNVAVILKKQYLKKGDVVGCIISDWISKPGNDAQKIVAIWKKTIERVKNHVEEKQ